jgi:ribonuclease-3
VRSTAAATTTWRPSTNGSRRTGNKPQTDVLATPHLFNGKSILQEWSQAEGLGLPNYITTEQSCRHGDPERFKSHVQVGTQLDADGFGRSRKDAEQNAAAEAMQKLQEL